MKQYSKEQPYGWEMIMDVHGCDVSKFTKEGISNFFIELCELIDMERHGDPVYWHDDSQEPHLRGCSGIQFIKTSNVVIHGCELLETAFINIFSCKEYDTEKAADFVKEYFSAQEMTKQVIVRW